MDTGVQITKGPLYAKWERTKSFVARHSFNFILLVDKAQVCFSYHQYIVHFSSLVEVIVVRLMAD